MAFAPTVAVQNVGGVDRAVWSTEMVTVTGYDPTLDGGTRIGGDTIKVCASASEAYLGTACGAVLGGPNSPLVVYGDTSQDGTWYAGHPYDVLGYEFGPKPFDPFVTIPDAQNEDDEWVFGLADPYDYAGNDIIDASGLFAGIVCNATCGNLPTVGITAYGGAGDDLVIGSQTGDFLAGGSGNDEIRGLRGADQIYGDSGVNVNILTRGLTIDTTNSSPRPTITGAGFLNNGTTIEPYPSPVRDEMLAGRDTIFGEGPGTVTLFGSGAGTIGPVTLPTEPGYDDIIFGDHGAALQNVADPNLPDTRLQKIQTTRYSSTEDTLRGIESRALQNGADDIIFGNVGRDVIVGGDGNDMADGNEGDDFVFGDNAYLVRTIGDFTSPHFQTLCGTLLYSRTDRTNACGGDAVNEDNSGLLLVDGTPRAYRDPDGAPWWAEYNVTQPVPHHRLRPGHRRAPAASATTTSPAARRTTSSSASWATT